jgi:hypothetical protein
VKIKGKLNTNLLSFQDDVEEVDASAADAAKFKIRSAHDVADSNGRLAREALNVNAMPQVRRRTGKIVDESSDEEEDKSSRGKQQEVDLGASALHGEQGKEERQAALMRLKEEIRELKKKSLAGAESQPAVGKVFDHFYCDAARALIFWFLRNLLSHLVDVLELIMLCRLWLQTNVVVRRKLWRN